MGGVLGLGSPASAGLSASIVLSSAAAAFQST
jgi:hypothetical protein